MGWRKTRHAIRSFETEPRPSVIGRDDTGEITLSRDLLTHARCLVNGAYKEGLLEGSALAEMLNTMYIDESSKVVDVRISVQSFEVLAGLASGLLDKYKSRDTRLAQALGKISTTGSAASLFLAEASVLSKEDLERLDTIAKERKRAAEATEPVLVTDEYTEGYNCAA